MKQRKHFLHHRVIRQLDKNSFKLRGFEIDDTKSLENALDELGKILDSVAGEGGSIKYVDIPDADRMRYDDIEAKIGNTLAKMPEERGKPYSERLKKISARLIHDEPRAEGIADRYIGEFLVQNLEEGKLR